MNNQQTTTLFEKIGGMPAVDAAVEIFYTKVMADETICHFFRWTYMKSQNAKQKAFLAYAFGAPLKYSGKSMGNAHAHLVEKGLNESHFNAVMSHLAATLQELGVAHELIAEAAKIAESTRKDILS